MAHQIRFDQSKSGPERFVRLVRADLLSTVLISVFCAGCSEGPARPADHGRTSIPPKGQELASPSSRSTAARFIDVSDRTGIDFTYRNGEEEELFSIPESLGGGIALLDYDADGALDLFAPGGGQFEAGPRVRGLPSALFRNAGGGTFSQVSRPAGVQLARHYTHGVAAADYDEDGFPDLLVTGYGGLLLLRNLGDGTFEDATLAGGLDDSLWSTSAGWGDLNGDGFLDMYVAHYVNWSFQNDPYCPSVIPDQREICAPKFFEGLPDVVFASNGNGTFRRASDEFGLREDGKGLGVLVADVDLDGDLDVYVANDTEPNFLYRNEGDGRLREVGMLSGSAVSDKGVAEGSMGVDLADFNLDGRPDLWVTNYERESIGLYRNDGNAVFHYVSQMTGVTAVGGLYVGWGTAFCDFDSDGDEDVFVSNGHVERFPEHAPVMQRPLLFENLQGKWFENVADAAGTWTAEPHMGRGAATGDIDEDGDLDLAVSRINQPIAVLANETPGGNHWLSIRLIGTRSPRSAIGSLVEIRTAGTSQVRQLKGGASYASTNDPRLHFGLGVDDRVDRLEIRWPSGTVQILRDLAADQKLTVVESGT